MKHKTKYQRPKRSLFGKLIKYTFIGFNILMLIWFIGGIVNDSESISNTSNDAEQAEAVIGTGLGTMMIIAGSIVLGIMTLLTSPKK